MGSKSTIQWTDASWTPVRARNIKTDKVGWYCEHATTGCIFCYSEGQNKWIGTGLPFKPGHRKDVEIFLDEEMLRAPLHWTKPRMIFVCSMTDLFADFVEDRWLDRIFSVMGACEEKGLGHTFQILTKRSERMQHWMTAHGHKAWNSCRLGPEAWPARNVWVGVSTERQEEADLRIPHLLLTPATVRFVSAEPLLGPIDFTNIAPPDNGYGGKAHGIDSLSKYNRTLRGVLDLVIVGGESGASSKARVFDLNWGRSIIDQCKAADVSCFIKQLGTNPVDSKGYQAIAGVPRALSLEHKKGGDPAEWPADLRVREMPKEAA